MCTALLLHKTFLRCSPFHDIQMDDLRLPATSATRTRCSGVETAECNCLRGQRCLEKRDFTAYIHSKTCTLTSLLRRDGRICSEKSVASLFGTCWNVCPPSPESRYRNLQKSTIHRSVGRHPACTLGLSCLEKRRKICTCLREKKTLRLSACLP